MSDLKLNNDGNTIFGEVCETGPKSVSGGFVVFWGFIILALFEAGFIVAVQLYLATSNVQQIAVWKALSATNLNFSMCMY